jgi:hypothetical protein
VPDILEAEGFRKSHRVTMLVETIGEDHNGVEHKLPPGSTGIIDTIDSLPGPQGLSFTVWIPIDEAAGQGIVNVFDEGDGHIANYISVQEEK